MKRNCFTLGICVALLAVTAAGVEVSPSVQETCCGTVAYSVRIMNDFAFQRVFNLVVDAPDGVTATLEPKTVAVPGKSEETLSMFVRPGCEPGEYAIKVVAECISCPGTAEEAEVVVRVTDNCAESQEPEVKENKTIELVPQETAETPTGAAVDGAGDNMVTIGLLLSILIVLLVILFRIERKSRQK